MSKKQYYDYSQLPILLDINEAAQLLRVSARTVGEMLRDERLRGFKVGREWRIARSVIIAHIEGEKT